MPAGKKRPPNLENYIEVADRIELFYKAFPNGSLQAGVQPYIMHTEEAGTFMVYQALAFRTPDDLRPGVGFAWEPLPGKTPYTRNSELMNAETSAWGRAIAALGIGLTVEGGKARVASMQEVMLRASEDDAPAVAESAPEPTPASPAATPEPEPTPEPPAPPALGNGDVKTLVDTAKLLLDASPDQESRTKISGKIKTRLVALGVQDTSGGLPDVLGRIPSVDAGMEFAKWLSSEIDAITSEDAEGSGDDDTPDF